MSGDPLADLHHLLRWTRTVYTVADLTHPFAFNMQGKPPCTTLHAVVTGSCELDISGACPISLTSGSLVLLPRGGVAELASTPRLRQNGMNPPPIRRVRENLFLMRSDGSGDRTIVISCNVQFEHPAAQRLVQLLEPVIQLEASRSYNADCVSRTLSLMSVLVSDLNQGDDMLVMNLADALLIEAIRTSIHRSPKVKTGWLAALQDRQIGIAAGLMHEAPERNWTLVSLATAAGMSRSVFAERFAEVVGEPPMRYLARLRMNLAVTMLTRGEESIGVIAHRLGYASEAGFSRAFRRLMGAPPSSVRRTPDGPHA